MDNAKAETDERLDHHALLMAQLPEDMRTRKPIATTMLVLLSLSMAALLLAKTGSLEPDASEFVRLGANFPTLTLRGQLWRLFASSFLHFGIEHLALNMLCLWSIGRFLEKLIGHGRLLCVYFLTATGGSLLSCAYHPDSVCAGASGAVFGMFGAGLAYVLIRATELKLDSNNLFGYLRSGLVFLGVNFVYSLAPDVDMAGHMGGLAVGIVVGGLLAVSSRWKDSAHTAWGRRTVTLATCVLGALLLFSWFAAGADCRLNADELSVEIGNLIRENLEKELEKNGSDGVRVQVEDCSLVHDGGDAYHGRVSIRFECEGETENLLKEIRVTYDGENVAYEMMD